MATLDRTRALMADLAAAIGLPSLPQDETGGYHLVLGEDVSVFVYGGDDESILVVSPIGPAPPRPDYAVLTYLLHANMFNADTMPFVLATDDSATLIQWGRLRIADLDGRALATVIDNLADRSLRIRAEIAS